jgi:cellulose 1,4-beta-cellobiosidase
MISFQQATPYFCFFTGSVLTDYLFIDFGLVVIEGAGDYDATYGVKGDGKDAVTLQYVTKNDNGVNAGSRMYFLEQGGEKYHMFKLKNKQFEFDVDVSNLPCGVNGALYFTAMEQDGGKSKNPSNGAGAKYGTGYCDAQCPKDIKWINGKVSVHFPRHMHQLNAKRH